MNKTLFWVAVIGIGAYYYKDSLGPITNSMGFGGNPTDVSLSNMESDNWFNKLMQGTQAPLTASGAYSGSTNPTISGTYHL